MIFISTLHEPAVKYLLYRCLYCQKQIPPLKQHSNSHNYPVSRYRSVFHKPTISKVNRDKIHILSYWSKVVKKSLAFGCEINNEA